MRPMWRIGVNVIDVPSKAFCHVPCGPAMMSRWKSPTLKEVSRELLDNFGPTQYLINEQPLLSFEFLPPNFAMFYVIKAFVSSNK